MTRSTTRPVLWLAGILLLGLALVQPAAAAPPQRATVYKVPKKIQSDCSVAVDAKISAWLATVPNNSTGAVREWALLRAGRDDHTQRAHRASWSTVRAPSSGH